MSGLADKRFLLLAALVSAWALQGSVSRDHRAFLTVDAEICSSSDSLHSTVTGRAAPFAHKPLDSDTIQAGFSAAASSHSDVFSLDQPLDNEIVSQTNTIQGLAFVRPSTRALVYFRSRAPPHVQV